MAVGSGTTLSILFQVLGIDEIKSKLASISPEFSKIQSSAQGATTGANATATSIKNVGSSATGVTTASGAFVKLESSSNAAAGSTAKSGQSAQQAKTMHDALGSTLNNTGGFYQKLQTGAAALSTEESRSSTAAQQAKTSHDALGSTLITVSGAHQKTTASATGLTSSNTLLSTSAGKVVTSHDAIASSSGTVSSAMTAQTGAMDKGTASTGKAAEGHNTLKSSMVALGGSATALVGSTVSLWESYDSLQDAQLRVDKATNTLQASRLKEQSLSIQLNKLTADGKTGTEQYALIQDKLALAHEKVTAAEGTLQNSQEDLNIIQIDFYKEIIPKIISVLGSATGVIANMGPVLGALKSGIKDVGGALSGISLSNPFFLAITVGAALATAFATNLFGFRDAINGIGVALGKAVPILKPFLLILGDLGKGFVEALGQGEKQSQAFGQGVSTGFEKAGTGAKTGTDQMKSYVVSVNGPIKNSSDLIAAMATDVANNMKGAGDSTSQFTVGLSHTLEEARAYYADLIKDTQTVTAQMSDIFSKHITLGTLDVGGFNQQIQKDIPQTLDVLFKEKFPSAMGEMKKSFDDGSKAVKTLSQTWSIFDNSTGQTVVNLNSLQAAAKANSLSMGDYNKIITVVSDVLKGRFVSSVDASVTNSKDLNAALQEQINRFISGQPAIEKHSDALNSGTSAQNAFGIGTKNTDTALQNQTGSLNDNSGAMADNSTVLSKLAKDTATQTENLQANNQILNTAAGMAELYNNAVQTASNTIVQNTVDVLKNALVVGEMTTNLRSAEGQAVSFAQGVVSMQEELNKTVVTINQNQGALAQLNAAMATNKPQQEAFNAGLTTEELATQKASLAVFDLQGKTLAMITAYVSGQSIITTYNTTIEDQRQKMIQNALEAVKAKATYEELHAEFKTGLPSLTAATKAYYDQKTAVEQDMIAISGTKGEIVAINEDMKDASKVAVEFNKGFFDQLDTFAKSKVALEQEKGAVAALGVQITNGQSITQSYNQGKQDMLKQTLESVNALGKEKGSLDTLNTAINSGLAQSVAYTEEQIKTAEATDKLAVSNAAAVSKINEMYLELKNGTTAAQQFNAGLDTSIESVLSWAGSMSKASGEAQGWVEGFQIVTNAIGVKLPEGFKFSEESAKTFMELMKGIPSALDKAAQSADAAGKSFTDGLVDSFRKGGKDLDTALKKLADDLGVNLTKEMKDALKPGLVTASTEDYLNKEFGALKSMSFESAGFDQMIGTMAGKITTLIKSNPQLAQAGNYILQLLTHPQNSAQWWGLLQTSINSLGSALDLTGTSASTLNQNLSNTSGYESQVSKIKPLSDALSAMGISGKAAVDYLVSIGVPADQAAKAIEAVGKSTGIAGQAATTASPQMQAFYQTIAGFGTLETVAQQVFETGIPGAIKAAQPALDTAINGFMQGGLSTFTQALLLLGPATTQAIGQVNTAFGGLNPLQPSYIAGITAIEQSFNLLISEAGQTTTQTNTALAGLNPVSSTFISGMTQIETSFNLLVTEAGITTTGVNTAFTQMGVNLPQTMGTLQTNFTNGMNALVNIANAIIPAQIPPIFTAMSTTIAGVYAKIQTDATNGFNGIVNIVNSIIPAQIPPIFTNMTNSIATVYGKMSTDAANGFQGIVNTATTIISSKILPIFTDMSNTIAGVYAKMQTDASNGFDAIVNIATSIIPVKLPPIFTNMANALPATYTKIQTDAETGFNNVVNAVNAIIPIKIPAIFTNMGNGLSTVYGKIQTDATNGFDAIVNIVNAIIPVKIPPIFTNMTNSIATIYGKMQTDANKGFESVVFEANSVIAVKVPAIFTNMSNEIVKVYAKIKTDATTGFDSVVTAANDIIPIKVPAIFTQMSDAIIKNKVYDKLKTDADTGFGLVVNSAQTIIPTKIPPIFNTMSVAVAGSYNRMQTDAAHGFDGIVNIAGIDAPKTVAPFTKANTDIVTAAGALPGKIQPSFDKIATGASSAAGKVYQPFGAAFDNVIKAAAAMASRIDGSMKSISSSVANAVKSVNSLKSAIDALKDKTVTITTVYRTVYQTTYAAKGFGPAIVNSPTHLVVGEAGPEAVSVVPLGRNNSMSNTRGHIVGGTTFAQDGYYDYTDYSSAKSRTHTTYSSKHRRRFGPPPQFIQDFGSYGIGPSATSQYAEPYGDQGNGTMYLSNQILGRLDSVTAGVTNFLGRASTALNTVTKMPFAGGITYAGGGGTTYADYGTTIPAGEKGPSGFIKLGDTDTRHGAPLNIQSRGSSNGSIDQTGEMIGRVALSVIDRAVNRFNFSVTNQNIIDGRKIYESQNRQFGLKKGTFLA